MADLMAGPNAPLTKAFISCGWRCITVDWLLDPSHDLADERRQQSLSCQLEEVIFIAAVIDCSTKSRAREIPRRFEDGRPAPGPFRSEVYPDGLPTLSGRDAKRVDIDSKACNYALKEIQKLRGRGGGSVRENPARSLRCMVDIRRGGYVELRAINGHLILAACTLSGARCKHQVLRHNLEEIQQWPFNGLQPIVTTYTTPRSGPLTPAMVTVRECTHPKKRPNTPQCWPSPLQCPPAGGPLERA